MPPQGESGLCWAHDPANAEKRRRGQSKGGRSKPSREIQAVKDRIQEMWDDVLTGKVKRADAAVCGQLANVLLRALIFEQKSQDQAAILERLEEVEKLFPDNQRGGRQWG